jgi:hypothetical protein
MLAVNYLFAFCRASLILLPPYSPNFTPIENAFAKFNRSCDDPAPSQPSPLGMRQ